MQQAGLSLEQAPPLSVPVRFFLTAPIFGLISALLLIIIGPDALVSRWTPAMLAITHGIVLGFLTSIMFGAMQQMLPVLAGAVFPRPKLSAGILHVLWVLGVLLLLAGFLSGQRALLIGSLGLLGGSVMLFGLLCGYALVNASSRNQSVPGMQFAVLSLIITVVLGVVLGLGHSGDLALLRPLGTNLHLMWGLIGWVALLIASVAWQVVPMFQITKPYPAPLIRWLAPSLFTLLIIHSLLSIFALQGHGDKIGWISLQLMIEITCSLLLTAFAVYTLLLQKNRLRKIRDRHISYWQLASVCLLLSVACWWLSNLADSAQLKEQVRLLSAVLFLAGFVMAVVTAMLYKIVAFLVCFHLQGINTQRTMAGEPGVTLLNMKTVIPEQRAKLQYTIYLLALVSIALATLWPGALSQLAGALWLLHFGVMAINLSRALFSYKNALGTEKEQLR